MVIQIRDDGGAVEGFVVIVLSALTGITVVLAVVASMFINHERARTAADFAALAASQTQECTAAAEVAKRNGAALQSCTVDEVEAQVTVSLPTRLGRLLTAAGAPQQFLASAHALS